MTRTTMSGCGEWNRVLPLRGACFTFVYRASNGELHRLEAVDLAAECPLSTRCGRQLLVH
jgi:hypothetical protein